MSQFMLQFSFHIFHIREEGGVHRGSWRFVCNLVQMDPKFLRNQRYAKKHNRVAGVEEEEVEEV
jgi:hypothetical protein